MMTRMSLNADNTTTTMTSQQQQQHSSRRRRRRQRPKRCCNNRITTIMNVVTSSLLLLLLLLSTTCQALNVFNNNNNKASSQISPESLPSLRNWKLLKDGKLSGEVMNHPVVPDGEVLTTAAVKQKDVNVLRKHLMTKNSNNSAEPPLTLTTVKGTQYQLIMNGEKKRVFGNNKKKASSSNNKQKKQQPIGYYYSTSLPYDQQLLFLEELTASIKALEAEEKKKNGLKNDNSNLGKSLLNTGVAVAGVLGATAVAGGVIVDGVPQAPIGSPEFLSQISKSAQKVAKTTTSVVLPYLEEQIQAAEQKRSGSGEAVVAAVAEQQTTKEEATEIPETTTPVKTTTTDTVDVDVDAKAEDIVQQALQAARLELQQEKAAPTTEQKVESTTTAQVAPPPQAASEDESTTANSAFDRWQQSQQQQQAKSEKDSDGGTVAASTTELAKKTNDDFLQAQSQQQEQAKAALNDAAVKTDDESTTKSTVEFTKPEPNIEVVTSEKKESPNAAVAKDNAITVEVERVDDNVVNRKDDVKVAATPATETKTTVSAAATSTTTTTPPKPSSSSSSSSSSEKAPTFFEYTANVAKAELPKVIATTQTISQKVQQEVLPQMLDYGGKTANAVQQKIPVFVEQSKRALKDAGDASQQAGKVLGDVGQQAGQFASQAATVGAAVGQQAFHTSGQVAKNFNENVLPVVAQTATDIWQDEQKRKGVGIAAATGAAVAASVAVNNKIKERQEAENAKHDTPTNASVSPFGGMNASGNASGISNNTMGYPSVTPKTPPPFGKQSSTPFMDKAKSAPPFGASPMDPTTTFGKSSTDTTKPSAPFGASTPPPQSRTSVFPKTSESPVAKTATPPVKTGASPFPQSGSSPFGAKSGSSPFGAKNGASPFGAGKTASNPFAKKPASPFGSAKTGAIPFGAAKTSSNPFAKKPAFGGATAPQAKTAPTAPKRSENTSGPFGNAATNAFASKTSSPVEEKKEDKISTPPEKKSSKDGNPFGQVASSLFAKSTESATDSQEPTKTGVPPAPNSSSKGSSSFGQAASSLFAKKTEEPSKTVVPPAPKAPSKDSNPFGQVASNLFSKKTDPLPTEKTSATSDATTEFPPKSAASPFAAKPSTDSKNTFPTTPKKAASPFDAASTNNGSGLPTKSSDAKTSNAASFYTAPRPSAPFDSTTKKSSSKLEAIKDTKTTSASKSDIKPSSSDTKTSAFFTDTSQSGYGLLSSKAGAPQDEEGMQSFYKAIQDKSKTDAIKDVLNGSSDTKKASSPASFFSGDDAVEDKATVTNYWAALDALNKDKPQQDTKTKPTPSTSSSTKTTINPYGATSSDIPGILQDAENGQGSSTFFRNGNAPTSAGPTNNGASSFAPKTPKTTNGMTVDPTQKKKPVIRPNEGYGVLSGNGSIPNKSDTSTDKDGGWSLANTKSQQEVMMDAFTGNGDENGSSGSTFL